MEVLEFIFICFGYLLAAYILTAIVEVIISYGDNKENPEKARRLYFVIFFVILLLLSTYRDNNMKKYYEEQLKEKEKYVTDLIEDSETLKELKDSWEDRDWEFTDEEYDNDDIN